MRRSLTVVIPAGPAGTRSGRCLTEGDPYLALTFVSMCALLKNSLANDQYRLERHSYQTSKNVHPVHCTLQSVVPALYCDARSNDRRFHEHRGKRPRLCACSTLNVLVTDRKSNGTFHHFSDHEKIKVSTFPGFLLLLLHFFSNSTGMTNFCTMAKSVRFF